MNQDTARNPRNKSLMMPETHRCAKCGHTLERVFSYTTRISKTIIFACLFLSTAIFLCYSSKIARHFRSFGVFCPSQVSQLPYCKQTSFSDSLRSQSTTPINPALRYNIINPNSSAWQASLYTSQPSHSSDTAWKELQKGITLHPQRPRPLLLTCFQFAVFG